MKLTLKQWRNNVHKHETTSSDLAYGGKDLGFSWRPCECCKTTMGGDRFSAYKVLHAPIDNAAVLVCSDDMSVCRDCMIYMANGDEPDLLDDTEDNNAEL